MPEHWLISTTAGRDARHRLMPPGPVTVGRARDASIVLDDRSVSRRHATLEWLPDAGAWRIINEAGTGGTWVNGVRMSSGVGLTLRAGDSLRIPPWDFRLVSADGSTAMAGFGARIALERFGAGLNSMQLLTHFDPAFLKIDPQFMDDLATNERLDIAILVVAIRKIQAMLPLE